MAGRKSVEQFSEQFAENMTSYQSVRQRFLDALGKERESLRVVTCRRYDTIVDQLVTTLLDASPRKRELVINVAADKMDAMNFVEKGHLFKDALLRMTEIRTPQNPVPSTPQPQEDNLCFSF